VKVTQADSSATVTDRRADRLSAIAAGSSDGGKLDSAAAELKLLVSQIPVQDGQPASYLGRPVPGLTGWAFSGPVPGEISDLLDDENGYYLARLDSLSLGGPQPFAAVKEEIRSVLKSRKAAAALAAQGSGLLRDAKATTLAAAAAKVSAVADSAGPFTRLGFVPGLGYANEAVGAAFAIPVGGLGLVQTDEAVVVMQVLARAEANRTEFDAMKGLLREQAMQGARERRVRLFLDNLRKEATVVDRRNEINAGLRRQAQAQP
jgi:peptidyl-prolyl cis-trans isomerase D